MVVVVAVVVIDGEDVDDGMFVFRQLELEIYIRNLEKQDPNQIRHNRSMGLRSFQSNGS